MVSNVFHDAKINIKIEINNFSIFSFCHLGKIAYLCMLKTNALSKRFMAMKKQLLFALMLLLTAATYVSCTKGDGVPQAPPPGYKNTGGGGNGGGGDGGNDNSNNGGPTSSESSRDESVDISLIREQIDFPSELVLPHTGVVVALKFKQPGTLSPQYFYPESRGGYGIMRYNADWLRFECDYEGIYFQANEYSSTPVTVKIHRQQHPEEAIQFTVRVASNEPYQWSTDPAASDGKIHFSYKGGRQTLTLKNNFACSLTEYFKYIINWIQLNKEAPLANGEGTTYILDIDKNQSDGQRSSPVDLTYLSLASQGFNTTKVGSITLVQDAALTLQKTATVDESNTITLEYTNNTPSTVQWTTSNSSVATISASGVVRGVSKGTATITASVTEDGETWSQTCQVTVRSEADVTAEVTNKISVGIGLYNFQQGLYIENNLSGPITVTYVSVSGGTSYTKTLSEVIATGRNYWIIRNFSSVSSIMVKFTYNSKSYTKTRYY